MAGDLPAGFSIDQPSSAPGGLPPGFAVDQSGAPPATSAWDAGAHGVMAGASAGWNDEMAGAVAAGQTALPPVQGAGMLAQPAGSQFLAGIAQLAHEHLTGQPGEATRAYDQARDEVRSRQKAMQAEHPYAFGAGELGGAVATMFAAPEAGAATLPARLIQGAKIGATYGGLQGAGESESDSLSGILADTAGGATMGGVGGAGGTLAGTALEKGAGLGYNYLGRPLVSLARGMVNPDAEASRRVVGALAADYPQIAGGKAQGLTPGEFAGASASGEPVMVADMGGETTRALLRSAANTSTQGRNAINTAVQDRFGDQSERVAQDIRNLAGGNVNAVRSRDQLRAEYDAQRGGAYQTAYEKGDRPLWSAELERLSSAPYVQNAINGAISKWRNYAVLDGFGAMNPPFEVANGVLQRTGGHGMPVSPNLQLWDYAARDLQDSARAAPPGSQQASLYNGLARGLKDELDRMVPSFRDARGIASDFFGGNNALEAGQAAANFKGDPAILRQQMAKMKPAERGLFQEGYADAKANSVLNMADNRDVTARLYNSPNERARMGAVFGPQALGPIETRLRLERIMDMSRTALGNSTTVRQLIEGGLAGGGVGAYLDGWRGMLEGAGAGIAGAKMGAANLARTGAQKLIGYVDQNTARRVAEMLTSSDPRVLRQGLQLASKNAGVARGLRDMEGRLLAATGAQQAPGAVRMLPGVLPAGAQENQHERGGRVDDQPDQREGGEPKRFAQGGRVDAGNINGAPTEAQKKAGNYAKDHVHIHGLDITIENAKGATRSGLDRGGKPWSVKMPAHYGYIKGTVGRDKDHVDVYVGPHKRSPHVFVVDQVDAESGRFDEHKVFLGFASRSQAKRAYLAAFSDGRGHARLGHMAEMPVDALKRWLDGGDTTKRIEVAGDDHKLTHKAVGYVAASRMADKHCSRCSMFRAGPSCTLVKDPILPGGWCRRFDPKE